MRTLLAVALVLFCLTAHAERSVKKERSAEGHRWAKLSDDQRVAEIARDYELKASGKWDRYSLVSLVSRKATEAEALATLNARMTAQKTAGTIADYAIAIPGTGRAAVFVREVKP